MAKLILDGLTLEQAKELAAWFEGQGEQDAMTWFDCQTNPLPHVYTDVGGSQEAITVTGDTVIVRCRSKRGKP